MSDNMPSRGDSLSRLEWVASEVGQAIGDHPAFTGPLDEAKFADLVNGAARAAIDALAKRDARIASEAAEKALRAFADKVDNGPTFSLPPSIFSAMARERADRLKAEREADDE